MESPSLSTNHTKIDEIRAEIRSHSQAVADPLCPNKAMHNSQLNQLSIQLLELNQIPYHCKQCKFQHRKGTIYTEHKPYAEIIISAQPAKIYTVDHNITFQIQKKKSEQVDELLSTLVPGTILSVASEDKLVVKYQNNIIGEITPRERRYNEILTSIDNTQVNIKCYLEYFQPREAQRVITELVVGNKVEERHVSVTERKAEELWITIQIFEAQKYKQVFEGLIEALDYHPDLFPAFLALGPRVVKDLEAYSSEATHDMKKKEKIEDMIDKLHSHFKIDMGTQFSIML